MKVLTTKISYCISIRRLDGVGLVHLSVQCIFFLGGRLPVWPFFYFLYMDLFLLQASLCDAVFWIANREVMGARGAFLIPGELTGPNKSNLA